MGMKYFKPHFEKLYTFADLLEDFFFFFCRSKKKKFDLFATMSNNKEKVIKNDY